MARAPSPGRAPLRPWLLAFLLTIGTTPITPFPLRAQADDPSPPKERVKLIFIHHSCGENWLSDGHGDLGAALARNDYFVSDTNYGWGPNSIGDRTDITDWPEWFTGPQSRQIMEALHRENGRLSSYARRAADPGGENRIILFKSCFPNSNLEGSPNDPPRRGHGLNVGNAKAIYNELLTYFRTQPGTLFVAITAPPVQDPTHGANARAFNNWLVREWLASYQGSNVAVFDFYNVLTGAENHHRFRNGAIEHVTNRGGNTLRYPTNGDNHPSPAGNRKATRELVPLLNVFYNRWQKDAPARPEPPSLQPPSQESHSQEPPGQEPPPPPLAAERADGVLDDFEGGANAWAVFLDEGSDSRVSFALDEAKAQSGRAGLRIDYDVAPASWGTCSLVYSSPRDWRKWRGLSLRLRSEEPLQKVVIVAYQGETSDDLSHFEFHASTDEATVNEWKRIEIPWSELTQPAWQGDSSVPFDPAKAMGVAFAFDAPNAERNTGRLWVDDIRILPNAPRGR